MTRHDDFIGQLEGYLDEFDGMTPLPNEVRKAVRAQLPSTTQTRRLTIVSTNMRIGLAAAAAVLVAIIGISFVVKTSVGPSPSPSETQSPATWASTGDLLMARSNQTATLLLNGKVLVAGGVGTAGSALDSAELYDPLNGTWTITGMMHNARTKHTATLLTDGRVLVVGGASAGGASVGAASAELYDPVSGTWAATGGLKAPRQQHTATLLLDGTVLVAGGTPGLGAVALFSAERYDPRTGAWTSHLQMREVRYGHTATLLPDGTVLVVGGFGGADVAGELSSAELYDPADGSWTETGRMTQGRGRATATLLLDGTVLVAGGQRAGGLHSDALASAELYHSASGSWTGTGAMLEADAFKTATLLPDGMVLVAGGYLSDVERPDHQSAELYDPASGAWRAAGTMVAAVSEATATLLPDGRVLVVGGSFKEAQLYAPASER